jgi:hypothetical protein
MKSLTIGCVLTLIVFNGMATADGADFDDLTLAPETAWSGNYPVDGTGGTGETTSFNSGGIAFGNFSDGDWGIWSGFAYSNRTDTTTPGFGNQFSAFPGQGADGSSNYGIGFQSMTPKITFAAELTPQSAMITNTTYAALSMLNGDAFSKKFGGVSGDEPDWLLITMTGLDTSGSITHTVDFYLADYRFSDNSQDYLIDDWTWVDLSGLGQVKSIEFSLSSSDVGDFGMNTPAYFGIDNVIPEPLTMSLLACGGLFLRRRHL